MPYSHLGRHSFACILLNSGVDMKTISKTLGHSTMRTNGKDLCRNVKQDGSIKHLGKN